MLYAFKVGKSSDGRYVGGEKRHSDGTHANFAYRYVDSLSDAILFLSVSEALSWLEHAAYRNGEHHTCRNSHLYLMKIEIVPVAYKEIGPLE